MRWLSRVTAAMAPHAFWACSHSLVDLPQFISGPVRMLCTPTQRGAGNQRGESTQNRLRQPMLRPPGSTSTKIEVWRWCA